MNSLPQARKPIVTPYDVDIAAMESRPMHPATETYYQTLVGARDGYRAAMESDAVTALVTACEEAAEHLALLATFTNEADRVSGSTKNALEARARDLRAALAPFQEVAR